MKHAIFCLVFLFEMQAAVAGADFAGCAPGSFVDLGPDAHIAIVGRSYSPKCARVKAGATLMIDASSHHPLQGVGETNPIFDELGGAVGPKTVTLGAPGEYGYFCLAHGDDSGAGMAGAILVE